MAVTIVVDTMKNGFDVARGKMKPREMATNLSKELIISAASIAGGIAGQALLKELPVMGYMLGSFVGSVVASVTLNIGEKTILSFCVETGFTFFGLVEQSYELPQDVIEKLGLDRNKIPVPKFRDTCKEFTKKYKDIQTEGFKRLGVLGDWEHPYITYDPKMEARQIGVFGDI